MSTDASTPSSPSTPTVWQRQIGVSYGLYRESSMSLRGAHVELGLRWYPMANQSYEVQWLGASQRYDSDATGSKNSVPYYETRIKGLYAWPGGLIGGKAVSAGWLLHYGYSDLRGLTSTDHPGYERISQQVWLPVRWQRQSEWRQIPVTHAWELGWLLYGQQTSRLSQASALYTDARNTQRTGLYLQWQALPSQVSGQAAWEPSVRLTRIGNSDTVRVGQGYGVTEPANWSVRVTLSRVW